MPLISENELKERILKILGTSNYFADEEANKQLLKLMAVPKFTSTLDVKLLSNRIIKQVREELADAHSISIKKLNQDLNLYRDQDPDHQDRSQDRGIKTEREVSITETKIEITILEAITIIISVRIIVNTTRVVVDDTEAEVVTEDAKTKSE